jgi:signal transduction histidine kinase
MGVSAGDNINQEVGHKNMLIHDLEISSQRAAEPTHVKEELVRKRQDQGKGEQTLRKEQLTLSRLIQSSDHEKKLMAYEIHDGIVQLLAAAILHFDSFDRLRYQKPEQAVTAFDTGIALLRQSYCDARSLIGNLMSPACDESRIEAAISQILLDYQKQWTPKIVYYSNVKFDQMAPVLANGIFRIVQEGLRNACQHSNGKSVRVDLLQHDDRIRIQIQDDGIGFDRECVGSDHYGLVSIQERARLLGGKSTIQSISGQGTHICVELPSICDLG